MKFITGYEVIAVAGMSDERQVAYLDSIRQNLQIRAVYLRVRYIHWFLVDTPGQTSGQRRIALVSRQ